MVAVYHAEQVIADRSGHYVQEDEPGLVVAAIGRVIGRGRGAGGRDSLFSFRNA